MPVLWDKQDGKIVSNNFPDITLDLDTQFGQWADPAVDLYPGRLRPEIDALNDIIYATVNNGVYRCGFAASQASYDEAVPAAVRDPGRPGTAAGRAALPDWRHADRGRCPAVGDAGPVRRVYYSHFKANQRRITDYPNLWGYARDLYSRPGVLAARPASTTSSGTTT